MEEDVKNRFNLFVLPYLANRCHICLTTNGTAICDDCLDALPKLGTCCPQCAEPNYHGHICGECLKSKPAFERVITPYIFEGPVAGVLQRFKHSSKVKGLNELTHSLIQALEKHVVDVVVPMPYHWRRLLLRGHSPSGLLANQLSLALKTPVVYALKRSNATRSQQTLNKVERQHNMRRAFSFLQKHLSFIKGKRILLVDDVLTTGATANEAARTLKRFGAKSVIVACIARTPPNQWNKPR